MDKVEGFEVSQPLVISGFIFPMDKVEGFSGQSRRV